MVKMALCNKQCNEVNWIKQYLILPNRLCMLFHDLISRPCAARSLCYCYFFSDWYVANPLGRALSMVMGKVAALSPNSHWTHGFHSPKGYFSHYLSLDNPRGFFKKYHSAKLILDASPKSDSFLGIAP
jgi:hypothetical protein